MEFFDKSFQGLSLSANEANEQGFFFRINGRNCKITSYRGNNTEIVIPTFIGGKPVRQVGTRAFYKKGLLKVTLPETLKVIRTEAFAYNALTTVNLPPDICLVADGAFANCKHLHNVITQKFSDIDISYRAFEKTPYLDLSSDHFTILGNMLLEIKPSASSKDTILNIPNGIKEIKRGACRAHNYYYYTKQLVIPASVRRIEENAFSNMRSLTKVVCMEEKPFHFLSIGQGAFGSFASYSQENPFLWSLRKAIMEGDPYRKSGWITFQKLRCFNTRNWCTISGNIDIYVPHSKASAFWRILDVYYSGNQFQFSINLEDYAKLFHQVTTLHEQIEMAIFLGQIGYYRRNETTAFLADHIYKAVTFAVKNNQKQRLMEYMAMNLLSPEHGFRPKKIAHLTKMYQNEATEYLNEKLLK